MEDKDDGETGEVKPGDCFTDAVWIVWMDERANSASGKQIRLQHYGLRCPSGWLGELYRGVSQGHCSGPKGGGGTVYVPAGKYTTGPIQMVSNLTLYFDAGSIVRFPATILPLTPGRQQGVETPTPIPLIGGHDLENVAVIGRGILTTNNLDWMRLHSRALRSVNDAGSANGANWERLLIGTWRHRSRSHRRSIRPLHRSCDLRLYAS